LGIRHEIRTLRQLRHPGVVHILDDGVEGGIPWYAMELLIGQTAEGYGRALWAGPAPPGERPPVARGQLQRVLTLAYRLCEPLAGRVPFGGRPAVAIAGHLREQPVPPSEIVTGVPPGLEALVLGLLAKEPRDRPGYAEDVMAQLAELGPIAEGPAARSTRCA